MDADFWRERWHEGKIGFHQDRPTPLLEQYWDATGVAEGARVLVPLCGKSLDLLWLAARGHRVLGVELSPIAVQQFFTEHGMTPRIHVSPDGTHYTSGPIEIVLGDAFALEDDLLASCAAVYDRAALIALPAAMRDTYVRSVYRRLPSGCTGLLITLEYPPGEKQGPPFPVTAAEVDRLFDGTWAATELERRDILAQQPGFQAEHVTALSTVAYRLQG